MRSRVSHAACKGEFRRVFFDLTAGVCFTFFYVIYEWDVHTEIRRVYFKVCTLKYFVPAMYDAYEYVIVPLRDEAGVKSRSVSHVKMVGSRILVEAKGKQIATALTTGNTDQPKTIVYYEGMV